MTLSSWDQCRRICSDRAGNDSCSIDIDGTMRGVGKVDEEEGPSYQAFAWRELRAVQQSSQRSAGHVGEGSPGRVDVAAGKFWIRVNRRLAPPPNGLESTGPTYQRPPGHANNASKVGQPFLLVAGLPGIDGPWSPFWLTAVLTIHYSPQRSRAFARN